MKTKTKITAISIMVLCITIIVGVLRYQNKSKNNEIVIGGAISLTGDNAMQGTRGLNGILLAIDMFNEQGGIGGKHIRFVSEDTQTSTKGTVNAYSKLATVNRVKGIITTGDIEFQAVNEISNKMQIVTMATTCSGMLEENRSPFLFRYCFNEQIEDRIIMDFIKNNLNDSVITIIYPNNLYGQEILKYSKQQAEIKNIHIANEVSYDPNSTDQRAIALKVMDGNPRIISARGFGNAFEAVMRNLSELGYSGIIIGDGTLTIPTAISNTKGIMEGAYSIAGDFADVNKDFVTYYRNRYLKKYNEEASVWDALGFDACTYLLSAINLSYADNISIKEALYKVDDIKLLLGNNKFGNSNDVLFEMSVFRIVDGVPQLYK